MEDVPTLTPTTSEKHSTDLQCRQQFNIQYMDYEGYMDYWFM